MSAVGRPALVRNVYPFDEPTSPLPRDVVLDTSFLVRAFVDSEPLHAICKTYLEALVAADVNVFFNSITDIELAEVAFRIAIRERHGNRRGARNDGRITGRAGRLTQELMESWELTLSTLNHARIEVGEVSGDYLALMTKHGLSSMDAVHAATALYVKADGLVTTDAGFGNIPAAHLRLFVDSSRVASCRRRRGGVA
ncbi:type II toxin-antitoxin system VapC family toxin [Subtercola endophyticus]|uniref:type II toxin-antitoxin system VapC family toxin n=1 Tax=Subtercola endophyticus TaxID=2895559 RepID=UPI0036F25BB5